MIRSTKKLITIFCVAFLILFIAVPAFAASVNSVNRVPQVSKDDSFKDKDKAPFLRIKEKDAGDFSNGDYFELALANAEWLKDEITTTGAVDVTGADVDVDYISKEILGITIKNITAADKVEIKVPLLAKITAEGQVRVVVDPLDSLVSKGTFVFAISAAGKTKATIEKVNKFGGRYGKLATICIDESSIGALGNEDQTIKLKLPPKYAWYTTSGVAIETKGGLVGSSYTPPTLEIENKRTLIFTFDPIDGPRSARGSILISGLQIAADRDAPHGDVVLNVDGDKKVTKTELVVAKRLDYGAIASVKEKKELVAGMWDQKTAKIKIEETLEKSLIVGREVAVILPEWVKIVADNGIVKVDGDETKGEVGGRQNELFITVAEKDTGTIKYEFELQLSIEADKSGDIVAEFSGAGMKKQEVVIAKAVAPITAKVAATDLKIGVQNQPVPDIIITETKNARIDDQYPHYDDCIINKVLTVVLPKGIDFASTPGVEVTEGNLEIVKVKVEKNVLTIPIDSRSKIPSTLKISDLKLTLDRMVPEGEFRASIGGGALVKNDNPNATIIKLVIFSTDHVVKFVFANVITPAPGETRTSVFTIGSTTYTVIEQNESIKKTMDVAPYIKDGRTFLPLRYAANALGVDDDNIIWDPVTKAVTVFKGDRVAQVTIGSKAVLVNGVTTNMDVAPEITDGRTMLPIHWLGQALGATIDWDAEARTVTIKQ
ncbi:MAG: copper amine oxidase N-terminal domain-containing protein [Dethiobacteria bacterium]|jgi:hypothetical protein